MGKNKQFQSEEIWTPETKGAKATQLQATLTSSDTSALQKYAKIVIGELQYGKLIKYELLTTFLSPLPGALGFLLRKQFYPQIFGAMGSKSVIGKSVTLRHPQKIKIGRGVIIDDYVVLDAKGENNTGITIGDNVIIGRGTVISCKNGNVEIGKNTNIATQCFIQSAKEVIIGQNVLFSAFVYLIGGGDHKTDRIDIPIIAQGQMVRGIHIQDNCFIGAGAKIQDGVVIGNDSIVGTGSVVRKSIPKFCIAAGVPAKTIRSRKSPNNQL